MVRIPARKKAEGEAFLAKVAEENANIQKTESGLMYEIIEPGNEIKPVNMQDKVRVLYTGTMKDGKEFDSTTKEDGTVDTAEFALQGVIKGWTEGLQLIGEGGKLKLWIPAELAYGQYGRATIGPNEPLMFDMEIIEVIPAPVVEETPAQ
jgi:FKBP-type peptidyl-prolyl cis-trans isomerase